VFGNYYGTAQDSVGAQREAGIDVILEIDWQGAAQVRAKAQDACSIFILPPSLQALEQRLRNRRQDDDATIAARLAGARAEMSHCGETDFLVLNDDFETALAELRAIIRAHRLRSAYRTRQLAATLADLLGG
jgi:guanylate kinase